MSAVPDQAIHGLYELLAQAGLPRPTPNYRQSIKGSEATLAVSWPALKMGLSFSGDNTAPLVKDGWAITPLTMTHLSAIAPLLSSLANVRFQYQLQRSAGTAKRTTSSDEQRLLAALLAAGLPMPDRNHTITSPDGSFRATPDFAWEILDGHEVKVALELDGWFHHGGRDLTTEITAAAATDPERKAQLLAFRKDQQAKDAAKRRMLTAAGWTVFSVLDTELHEGKTDAVVADVKAAIAARSTAPATAAPVGSATMPSVGEQVPDAQEPGWPRPAHQPTSGVATTEQPPAATPETVTDFAALFQAMPPN